jgi:hypothetical protein
MWPPGVRHAFVHPLRDRDDAHRRQRLREEDLHQCQERRIRLHVRPARSPLLAFRKMEFQHNDHESHHNGWNVRRQSGRVSEPQ